MVNFMSNFFHMKKLDLKRLSYAHQLSQNYLLIGIFHSRLKNLTAPISTAVLPIFATYFQ